MISVKKAIVFISLIFNVNPHKDYLKVKKKKNQLKNKSFMKNNIHVCTSPGKRAVLCTVTVLTVMAVMMTVVALIVMAVTYLLTPYLLTKTEAIERVKSFLEDTLYSQKE